MLTMVFCGWWNFVDFLIFFALIWTPLNFFYSEHMFLDFVFIWGRLPGLVCIFPEDDERKLWKSCLESS